MGNDEEDGDGLESGSGDNASWTIVTADGDPLVYLKAKEYNELCLARARRRIPQSDLELYSSAIESLQCLSINVKSEKTSVLSRHGGPSSRTALLMGLDEGSDLNMLVEAVPQQRECEDTPAQKRRKILKDLKRFMRKGDCRNPKQKGWSNEGYRYH